MNHGPHPGQMTRSAVRSRPQIMNHLGALLVQREHLDQHRLDELSQRAEVLDEPIDELLVREHAVPEETVLELLSEITNLPFQHIDRGRIQPEALHLVPTRAVVNYRIMPLGVKDETIHIATDRVHDLADEDDLHILLGYTVAWVLCPSREVSACIKHYYGVGLGPFIGLSDSPSTRATDGGEAGSHPDISGFVEQVIQDAIEANATDIHFEPGEHRFDTRYRIDGVLCPVPMPTGVEQFQKSVISNIKVMAQLNIAEKRLPQDGRFTFPSGDRAYDIRVSALPTRHGEEISLRILNREATFLEIDELGMEPAPRRELDDLLTLPHGMILFTGPTGSGKTTSLYASLAHLNDSERKIVTLEDPVEYQIAGITQLQINPDIHFTFASGLRSVLRHDPDVILVGEIRDEETADIAISSALTGHLVLSTLHTNDSASAITRLIDMGIEPYLVSSSLEGVIAQRLVRRSCPACRELVRVEPALLEELHLFHPEQKEDPAFYRGRGCPYCRFTGYRSRDAIFEVLRMNDEIRSLAVEHASSTRIMRQAIDLGLITLRQHGWERILRGETSIEEMLRVTRLSRARSEL